MRIVHVVLALTLPVWMGCAASFPEVSYTPPEEQTITTITHVEEPFDAVWSRMIKGLSRSDLSIEKEDRSQGLIVVSLLTGDSHEYVDCGSMAYGAGKEMKVAQTTRRRSRYSTDSRDALLAGTVYITVEKEGALTLVSLKPYYDVAVNASSARYHGQDRWVTIPPTYDDEGNVISPGQTKWVESRRLIKRSRGRRAITFVTNTPNQVNWGTEEDPMYVSCCSTGKLEERILSLARGTAPPDN